MKIVIVKLSALGDIVHGSIVLQFIKAHIKDANITWVVDERFAGILESHEHIDKLIKIKLKDKKFKQSYQILKKAGHFDIAIDFQGLLKSAIIGRILCENLVGFDKNSIREKIATFFYKKSFFVDYNENIILRNLNLASKALGFGFNENEILEKKPCFLNLKKATPTNQPKKILIAIGSSWKSKMYPKDLHIKFIDLLDDFDIFLCYGNESEKLEAEFIASRSKAKILPKMKLQSLALKLNEFNLIIGSDSGISHLAFAQNIPSITLFGPTPHQRNTYTTPINKTLHVKKINPKKLNKNDDCIKLIKPKDIANLAKELLWI